MRYQNRRRKKSRQLSERSLNKLRQWHLTAADVRSLFCPFYDNHLAENNHHCRKTCAYLYIETIRRLYKYQDDHHCTKPKNKCPCYFYKKNKIVGDVEKIIKSGGRLNGLKI